MTSMSQGRAQKWVNRIYQWEVLLANVNVHYFADWDHFRSIFRNEFYPLHADAVATNILEGQTYFQGNRNVDNYLDDFRDLISESGYTSPKTIVVKFRRGLDPKIGDAVATMAANRPDDLDPEGWYEAAVRVDQNRAMNAAFRGSIEAPNANRPPPCEPIISEAKPEPSDVVPKSDEQQDVTDIKGMSADDICRLLQQLSGVDKPLSPTLHPKTPKTPTTPTTPLTCTNQFQRLVVEETSEDDSEPPLASEATCERQPKRPQWERRLPKQPKIGAAEVEPNSLYLRVEIESTDTQRKYGVRALVDSGATGLLIDREYVKSNQIPTTKLSQPIPVFNVDGTTNTEGSISEVAELLLRYNGHSERALFCVTGLGRQNLILGHTWLKEHNPEVDWRTGKVEMSRCSPWCCNGCRTEAREERRMLKREAASISACRSGSFPATVEDAEEEDAPDNEPTASDIPFDLEEGDCVWAM
jgi:predicted aspartyl protease